MKRASLSRHAAHETWRLEKPSVAGRDGLVASHHFAASEAFLTGESRPVRKGTGDEVVAGAVNGEGALTVQVTRTGEATNRTVIAAICASNC